MSRRNLLTNAVAQLLLVLGIVLGINMWSYDHFTRLDLTEDRLYSLDLQTRALVHRVDKPLLTKIYFSEGLCHPHQNHKARVVDMLEELQAYSHGLMEIEIMDPTGNPEQIDQARRFGIESFEQIYNCDDRQETRDVFMGISMLYGDRQEVLSPVVNLNRLEYDLAIVLKRLVAGEDPKRIGWATGHGELPLLNREVHPSLKQLRTELAKEFILEPVTLGGEGPIDESIDLLFLVEPRTTVSDRALYQLDQFIMRGGAAAIHLTNYAPNPRAPDRARRFYHGLEPLLAHYGVQVNRDIVFDTTHHFEKLKHPLIPVVDAIEDAHITVSTVDTLLFPYSSTLDLTDLDVERVQATVLAETYATSGAVREIESVNPDHYVVTPPGTQRGQFPVLVAMEGSWTSFFADKEIPLPSGVTDAVADSPESKLRESVYTRLIVGGSSSAVWFGESNQQLTRNLADWMAEDESLIAIRGKTHTIPSFEPPDDETVSRLKRINLLGGIGLMFGFGIAIWASRSRPWATRADGGGLWTDLQGHITGGVRSVFGVEQIRASIRQLGHLLRPRPKTLGLVVLGAIVLAPSYMESVDIFGTESDEIADLNDGLPVLPAIPRESIERVEITHLEEQIILEQEVTAEQRELHDLGTWTLRSPIEADADIASIRALVATFRKEIPVDARLESGNLQDYGLDPNRRIIVEVFTGDDEPALSYVIGFDVAGSNGSTYLKLPGSDDVYRANIGGRARFERKGTDWRNRVVMGFEVDQVESMRVTHASGRQLNFYRSSQGATWSLLEAPSGMVIDQRRVASAIKSLGGMRAGAFLGTNIDGFSPPQATVDVTLSDDSTHQLEVGTPELQGAVLVRSTDDGEVYQVSSIPIDALMQSPLDYEDRTLFAFEATRVDTLEYRMGAALIRIQQDEGVTQGVRTWIPLVPSNYSLELKRTFFMVNTLASLRADERSAVSPEDAGIRSSSHGIVITFLDGSKQALIIGNETRDRRGGPAWFVSISGSSDVFVIDHTVLSTLKAGFVR